MRGDRIPGSRQRENRQKKIFEETTADKSSDFVIKQQPMDQRSSVTFKQDKYNENHILDIL